MPMGILILIGMAIYVYDLLTIARGKSKDIGIYISIQNASRCPCSSEKYNHVESSEPESILIDVAFITPYEIV